MEKEKLRKVSETIRSDFERIGLKKNEYPKDWMLNNKVSALEHCHHLLDIVDQHIEEGKLAEAERTIGFIQGSLWGTYFYTLEHIQTTLNA